MTRFRRLVDDDEVQQGPGGGGIGLSFGAFKSVYDIHRGLLRMQSSDPASVQKSLKADSIIASFGDPSFPDRELESSLLYAELLKLQAKTNHPDSPRAAAGELARLYDLFAKSAQPAALLAGRKELMESTLYPIFAQARTEQQAISTIVRAVSVYWLGAPVAGGGVVTGFLGAVELTRELHAIYSGGANTSDQVAKRLARCFIIATKRVQYTIPPAFVGFMTVFPPLAI